MIIREVRARIIEDSRGQETIAVSVNGCEEASSPNGKSTGKYEATQYYKSLKFCVDFLNKWGDEIELNKFEDLVYVGRNICRKLKLKKANLFGANVLYALESAILKALAKEKKKQLYEIVGGSRKIPYPVGNVVGGGLHSSALVKHPDIQEFLVIPKSKSFMQNLKIMNYVYTSAKKSLKTSKVNDEGALLVSANDQEVLDLLNESISYARKKFHTEIELGVDVASSTLFKNRKYNYADKKLDSIAQCKFMQELILNYDLGYMEDSMEEHDFKGFAKIQKNLGNKCLIVGDDLTATQYNRVTRAIQTKSINSMIIKPNQNGSLLELKKIFSLCKKNGVKTILSHRSGETMDDALADYAVGFGADYIKCGVATSWREVKLKRLADIENSQKFSNPRLKL